MRISISSATLVLAATLSGQALASDLLPGKPGPASAPQYKAPAAQNVPTFVNIWGGAYAGVFAGYSSSKSDTTASNGVASSVNLTRSGVPFGLFGGYNYAINQFIVGGEADIGLDLGKKSADYVNLVSNEPGTLKSEETYTGRARLRAGYAVLPQMLLFGAGGVTVDGQKITASEATLTQGTLTGNKTQTRVGWNLGAGIDYAILSNVFARVEYIHDDLGKKTYDFASGNVPVSRSASLTKETLRAGVAYKF